MSLQELYHETAQGYTLVISPRSNGGEKLYKAFSKDINEATGVYRVKIYGLNLSENEEPWAVVMNLKDTNPDILHATLVR